MSLNIYDQHDENVAWNIPIEKSKDARIIEGVVLAPHIVDAHGDIIIKEGVIEEAGANFLTKYNELTKLGVQHSLFDKSFQLRQSYITKSDIAIGTKKIKKGSWIIQVKVLDDDIWKKIKDGAITGFSIGGRARAKMLEKSTDIQPKRELTEIFVEEISVVDMPANLMLFDVIKSKTMEEKPMDKTKQSDEVKDVATVIEKNENKGDETIEATSNEDVLKAMEKVANSVSEIAKSLDADKKDESTATIGDEKKVIENEVEVQCNKLSTLDELENAITRAKALSPDRVENLTKAVESIQGMLSTLTQKTTESATVAKIDKIEKTEKNENSNPTATKLDELVENLTKRVEKIDKRVEEMMTKAAPRSIGDNETDSEDKKITKSLWSGVLFN